MIHELYDFNKDKWVYPKKDNANVTWTLEPHLPNGSHVVFFWVRGLIL